jgi:hypothetical protein
VPRRSSIVVLCPQCRETAYVQSSGRSERCLNCNFDYVTLAADREARERWMLENLRRSGMEKIGVLLLYRYVMDVPPNRARDEVYAFAAKNGVQFGLSESTRRTLQWIGIAILITAVLVVLLLLKRSGS